MREEIRDPLRLIHILQAAKNIQRFMQDKSLEDLKDDSLLFYGVVKNIEIIGEASYKLTKEFKLKYSQIPWASIEKMRHILVHEYYNTSPIEIFNVYTQDLPILIPQIEKIEAELKESNNK